MNVSPDEDSIKQENIAKIQSPTSRTLDETTQEITKDILGEYSELILDSLANSDVLGEIPVVKTISAIYRLVSVVKAKRFHKKLVTTQQSNTHIWTNGCFLPCI